MSFCNPRSTQRSPFISETYPHTISKPAKIPLRLQLFDLPFHGTVPFRFMQFVVHDGTVESRESKREYVVMGMSVGVIS